MRADFFKFLLPWLGRTSDGEPVQQLIRKYQRHWQWRTVDGRANWCLLLPMEGIHRVRRDVRWHGSVSMLLEDLRQNHALELKAVRYARPGDLMLRAHPKGHAGVALAKRGTITVEGNVSDTVQIKHGQPWDAAWRWWRE